MNVSQTLKANPLFKHIPATLISMIAKHAEVLHLKSDTTLIKQGESTDYVYFVQKGRVNVSHNDSTHTVEIAKLDAGDVFGELALLDKTKRSADVVTLGETAVIRVHAKDIKALASDSEHWHTILQNLNKLLSLRVRTTNTLAATALKKKLEHENIRHSMVRFIACMIIGLSAYAFVLPYAKVWVQRSLTSSIISLALISAFIFGFAFIVKTSRFPLSAFGFTTHNWRKSVKEAIVFSIPVMLLTVVAKFILLKIMGSSETLFSFTHAFNASQSGMQLYLTYSYALTLYLASATAQEIMCRGALQSPLMQYFEGKYAAVYAILLSNVLFAVSHLHMSTAYACLAIIPGCYWGWLYMRNKSLIAPILSHLMIGTWALFIVGIQAITAIK